MIQLEIFSTMSNFVRSSSEAKSKPSRISTVSPVHDRNVAVLNSSSNQLSRFFS